jgi:hypothetical protein
MSLLNAGQYKGGEKMDKDLTMKEISPEELGRVGGGASDHSQVCGMELSFDCFFCTRKMDGQHVFDGVLRDTIGCGLSPNYLGNINGKVLVSGRPAQI